jgi:hypothetical protein
MKTRLDKKAIASRVWEFENGMLIISATGCLRSVQSISRKKVRRLRGKTAYFDTCLERMRLLIRLINASIQPSRAPGMCFFDSAMSFTRFGRSCRYSGSGCVPGLRKRISNWVDWAGRHGHGGGMDGSGCEADRYDGAYNQRWGSSDCQPVQLVTCQNLCDRIFTDIAVTM